LINCHAMMPWSAAGEWVDLCCDATRAGAGTSAGGGRPCRIICAPAVVSFPIVGAPATCPSCGGKLDRRAECVGCAATHASGAKVTGGGASLDPLIGREVIGQFVIRRRLGAGGMGAVYLADQPSMGRQAVIKVLHPQLAIDKGTTERFHLEARAASQLNHPHIVTVFNHGAMDDGTLFLAMEHLEGEDLQQRLARKGALPVETAVAIGRQIALALAEAHSRGVVHRDLKPSNVMLVQRVGQEGDFVKVLDFGIAKMAGTQVTSEGLLCGTPRYMSPEQLNGVAVDGRADLYALGIVLYEVLAGRTPFESREVLGYVEQHVKKPPPPMAEVAGRRARKIPAALEALVMRLLAKEPGQRPASAVAVADELGRVLAADPVPATATTLAGGGGEVAAAAPAVRQQEAQLAPARSGPGMLRRMWLWICALAAAIGDRLPWRRKSRIERAWDGVTGLFRPRGWRARLSRRWQSTRRWIGKRLR
jgi:serine/threonine-protein kinase